MGDNTTTVKGKTIMITPHSTWNTDWTCAADLGWETIKIHSIIFKGGDASDALVIRNGAVDGPEIVNWVIAGGSEEQVFYGYGQTFTPYIESDDCTGDDDCRIMINFV